MTAHPESISSVAEIRTTLIMNGYLPIPANGKRPVVAGWSKLRMTAETVDRYITDYPTQTNTGLLTGHLVAIDVDAPDDATADILVGMVLDLPNGAEAPCRVGRAPKCLFVFRTREPLPKASTGKFLINGERCEVEVLGDGQQFIADGIHPETGKPYTWSNGSPLEVPLADLPLITAETLAAFIADCTSALASRGVPKKATSLDESSSEPVAYTPFSGDGVWADIKDAAFANLDAWVPQLRLVRLMRGKSGYHAVASFRPSNRAGLPDAKRNRALEISTAGICDHSDDNRGYSPIDLVMACHGVSHVEAADWLRGKLGIGEAPKTYSGDAAASLLAGVRARQGGVKKPAPKAANDNTPQPLIVSSGDLVRGFTPPDYAIDGVVQAGFLYSVTANTGAGKTAVLLYATALTALGLPLGEREVRKGRTLYFAGENPDDVTMRWIAMAHHLGFDPDTIDSHFIKGTFSIPGMFARIAVEVKQLGGVDLIVIDTSAAYFQGKDENTNTELGAHARELRTLTTLEGRPCVLVAAHPTKSAANDNLIPRGGGAFIAEVDGNLVCVKTTEGTVKLHWQGKHRGPDFAPIMFELKTVTAPALKDTRGRDVPTVMASVLSNGEVVQRAKAAVRDEDDVLLHLDQNADASMAMIADALRWTTATGEPAKSRVRCATDKLRTDKLLKFEGRKWVVTAAGHSALVDIRAERHRAETASASIAKLTESRRA